MKRRSAGKITFCSDSDELPSLVLSVRIAEHLMSASPSLVSGAPCPRFLQLSGRTLKRLEFLHSRCCRNRCRDLLHDGVVFLSPRGPAVGLLPLTSTASRSIMSGAGGGGGGRGGGGDRARRSRSRSLRFAEVRQSRQVVEAVTLVCEFIKLIIVRNQSRDCLSQSGGPRAKTEQVESDVVL